MTFVFISTISAKNVDSGIFNYFFVKIRVTSYPKVCDNKPHISGYLSQLQSNFIKL